MILTAREGLSALYSEGFDGANCRPGNLMDTVWSTYSIRIHWVVATAFLFARAVSNSMCLFTGL